METMTRTMIHRSWNFKERSQSGRPDRTNGKSLISLRRLAEANGHPKTLANHHESNCTLPDALQTAIHHTMCPHARPWARLSTHVPCQMKCYQKRFFSIGLWNLSNSIMFSDLALVPPRPEASPWCHLNLLPMSLKIRAPLNYLKTLENKGF